MKLQRGYYDDGFLGFMTVMLVIVFGGLMLLIILAAPPVEEAKLAPGVFAVDNTICGDPSEDGVRTCVLTVSGSDVDEVLATKHVLMLEPGEETAETIYTADITEEDMNDAEAMEAALDGPPTVEEVVQEVATEAGVRVELGEGELTIEINPNE